MFVYSLSEERDIILRYIKKIVYPNTIRHSGKFPKISNRAKALIIYRKAIRMSYSSKIFCKSNYVE